ncbi:MAG: CBS domain-containing protein [Desulfobulbaceae bacterium]|nr:CBS domain-containing protein [Desulfobulbaceae bacterium]
MFIATFMTAPPRTVSPDTLLAEARELMTGGNFRHLPVVDEEGRLAGIITDRDLRSAMPTGVIDKQEASEYRKRFARTTVRAIMTETVACLPLEATLDDALLLFDRTRVGALPVLNSAHQVVGILSVRDLLTAYRQLFGLGEKGSTLIGVADDGDPNVLTRLTKTLETGRIPFTRLIRTGELGGKSALIYVRVHTHNLNGVHNTLAGAGFRTVAPGIERSDENA